MTGQFWEKVSSDTVKQAALHSLEVDEPSRVMVGPHPAAGPRWRCVQVDPLGAYHRGSPYTAPWLLFHPQSGSLALPALRPCFLQGSFHPKPKGSLGSAVCLWDQELKGER